MASSSRLSSAVIFAVCGFVAQSFCILLLCQLTPYAMPYVALLSCWFSLTRVHTHSGEHERTEPNDKDDIRDLLHVAALEDLWCKLLLAEYRIAEFI
jgi:hypothetical protein